jgi:hypothetical protein
VHTAVQFHNQVPLGTAEVDDGLAHWVLAAKLETI